MDVNVGKPDHSDPRGRADIDLARGQPPNDDLGLEHLTRQLVCQLNIRVRRRGYAFALRLVLVQFYLA